MSKDVVAQMLELLEVESTALLNGDYSKLKENERHKTELAHKLQSQKLTHRNVHDIAAKANRNARLFAAAIKGVRSSQARMRALTEARDGLSLYTQQGQKLCIQSPNQSIERKA